MKKITRDEAFLLAGSFAGGVFVLVVVAMSLINGWN